MMKLVMDYGYVLCWIMLMLGDYGYVVELFVGLKCQCGIHVRDPLVYSNGHLLCKLAQEDHLVDKQGVFL